jgi:hypothetical protein
MDSPSILPPNFDVQVCEEHGFILCHCIYACWPGWYGFIVLISFLSVPGKDRCRGVTILHHVIWPS